MAIHVRRLLYKRVDGVFQHYWIKRMETVRKARIYDVHSRAWVMAGNWLVMFTVSYSKKCGHDRPRLLQWEAVVRARDAASAVVDAESMILKVTNDNVHVVSFLTSAKVGVATERTGREAGEAVFRKQLTMGGKLYTERHSSRADEVAREELV